MTTLSIPINEKMQKFIDSQIAEGKAENKAEVVRRALTYFAEQQAIADVLEAEQDIKAGKIFKYIDKENFKKNAKKLYE